MLRDGVRRDLQVANGLVPARGKGATTCGERQAPRRTLRDGRGELAARDRARCIRHRHLAVTGLSTNQIEAQLRRRTLEVLDLHANHIGQRRAQRDREHWPVQGVATNAYDLRGCRHRERMLPRDDVVRLLRIERRHSGSHLPESVGELHKGAFRRGRVRRYLTAPAVIPRVSVRWKMRKKTRVGRRPRSAEALVVVTSISRSPCRTLMATGTVWLSLLTRKVNGIRNSFQVQMKKKIRSTLSVGRLIGTMTRHRIAHRLAPSRDAASRISLGKVP